MSHIRNIIENTTDMVLLGTHDGIFYPDELFAIVMIKSACQALDKEIRIIRTRENKTLSACDIRVDVGRKYDPAAGDFDHHHDKNLQSSFGLVYNDMMLMCPLNDLSNPFFAEFVRGIDIMDTNPTSIQFPDAPVRNLNQIIAGFNDLENQEAAFARALAVAADILKNEFRSAEEKGKAEVEYIDREILENNVAVFEKYSPIWKDKGDHDFAIMPYSLGWQIMARDARVVAVPEAVANVEGFIFRHYIGFMAAFATKRAAMDAAKMI